MATPSKARSERLVGLHLPRPSLFALVGICIYLAGLVLPLPSYLSLTALAVMSAPAVFFRSPERMRFWSPLTIAVLVFLASVGLSTLVSEDIGRSIRLSAPMLPAILLFMVVRDHLEGPPQIRLLYLTCSAIALVMAVVVLWSAAWHGQGGAGVRAVISPRLGPPILIVPNDLTFLSVIAPLSLVLFYREPRGLAGIVAVVSIALSLGAICIFATRTAALTFVLGLVVATVLAEPRQRFLRNMLGICALICVALLANALLFSNSQVITRLVWDRTLTGRTELWSTAWVMFQQAPLLGKGPHTFGVFDRIPWAHNVYLEVMAEQGLLGLVALGGMLLCGLLAAWNLACSSANETRHLGAGALASLLGMYSGGVVELSLAREWVVTMLFLLSGIIGGLLAFPELASSSEGADK